MGPGAAGRRQSSSFQAGGSLRQQRSCLAACCVCKQPPQEQASRQQPAAVGDSVEVRKAGGGCRAGFQAAAMHLPDIHSHHPSIKRHQGDHSSSILKRIDPSMDSHIIPKCASKQEL
jgi:hypothetical protein